VHAREGSKNPVLDKLYFVGVLALGLVPWLAAAWTGLRRALGFLRRPAGPKADQAPLHRWTVAAVLLAGLWPLLFYTLSGSKLPPYILPVMVPILALACAFEREGEERRALARCGRELLVLGSLFLLVGPFLLKDKSGVGWVLAAGAAFVAMGCWALRPRGLTGARWMAGLGAILLLFTVSAEKAAGPGKEEAALVRLAPADAQWISCGNYYQVIPFVSGRRTVVVAGTGELAFGRDHLDPAERDRWFQEDDRTLADVGRRLRSEDPARPVWALVDRDTWRNLPDPVLEAWAVRGRSPACVLVSLK
jgi:hypothetical protein